MRHTRARSIHQEVQFQQMETAVGRRVAVNSLISCSQQRRDGRGWPSTAGQFGHHFSAADLAIRRTGGSHPVRVRSNRLSRQSSRRARMVESCRDCVSGVVFRWRALLKGKVRCDTTAGLTSWRKARHRSGLKIFGVADPQSAEPWRASPVSTSPYLNRHGSAFFSHTEQVLKLAQENVSAASADEN